MATNIGLTRELAVQLICGKRVLCPACHQAELTPRYTHKLQHTEFICTNCKTVFHAVKQI